MAYHGADDPFQCGSCGAKTADRVAFFLHLARVAHN
jgi:hunchback-like protein